eukprot:1110119-Prymnesium_polylepis.1
MNEPAPPTHHRQRYAYLTNSPANVLHTSLPQYSETELLTMMIDLGTDARFSCIVDLVLWPLRTKHALAITCKAPPALMFELLQVQPGQRLQR